MPDGEYTVQNVARMPGIHDVYPLKARLCFAKAWLVENQAGECTVEAEQLLSDAVRHIEEEQTQLLAG